jgi:hypothetical protein
MTCKKGDDSFAYSLRVGRLLYLQLLQNELVGIRIFPLLRSRHNIPPFLGMIFMDWADYLLYKICKSP